MGKAGVWAEYRGFTAQLLPHNPTQQVKLGKTLNEHLTSSSNQIGSHIKAETKSEEDFFGFSFTECCVKNPKRWNRNTFLAVLYVTVAGE